MFSRTLIALVFAAVALAAPSDISGQTVNVAQNNVSPVVKDVTANPNVGVVGTVSNIGNKADTSVVAPVKDITSTVGDLNILKRDIVDQLVNVEHNNVSPSVKDVAVNPNAGVAGSVTNVANNADTSVVAPVKDVTSTVGDLNILRRDIVDQLVNVEHNNVNPSVKDVTANPNVGAQGTVQNIANGLTTNVAAPVKDVTSTVGNVGVGSKRSELVNISNNNIAPSIEDVNVAPTVNAVGSVSNVFNNANTNIAAPISGITSTVGDINLLKGDGEDCGCDDAHTDRSSEFAVTIVAGLEAVNSAVHTMHGIHAHAHAEVTISQVTAKVSVGIQAFADIDVLNADVSASVVANFEDTVGSQVDALKIVASVQVADNKALRVAVSAMADAYSQYCDQLSVVVDVSVKARVAHLHDSLSVSLQAAIEAHV